MLTATNAPPARALNRCAARANSSLPVPGSPATRMGSEDRAALARSRKSPSTPASRVMMPTASHCARSCSRSASSSGACRVSAARSSRSSVRSRLRVCSSCCCASASWARRASAVCSSSRSAPVERATATRAASRSSSSASTTDSWRTSAWRIPSSSPSRRRKRRAEPKWLQSSAPALAPITAARGNTTGGTTLASGGARRSAPEVAAARNPALASAAHHGSASQPQATSPETASVPSAVPASGTSRRHDRVSRLFSAWTWIATSDSGPMGVRRSSRAGSARTRTILPSSGGWSCSSLRSSIAVQTSRKGMTVRRSGGVYPMRAWPRESTGIRLDLKARSTPTLPDTPARASPSAGTQRSCRRRKSGTRRTTPSVSAGASMCPTTLACWASPGSGPWGARAAGGTRAIRGLDGQEGVGLECGVGGGISQLERERIDDVIGRAGRLNQQRGARRPPTTRSPGRFEREVHRDRGGAAAGEAGDHPGEHRPVPCPGAEPGLARRVTCDHHQLGAHRRRHEPSVVDRRLHCADAGTPQEYDGPSPSGLPSSPMTAAFRARRGIGSSYWKGGRNPSAAAPLR